MGIRNNNLDTAKTKIEIINYCSNDIGRVVSEEGILSKPFSIPELSSPDKIHVHLRGYTSFYGGYAEHTRNILFGLANSGECVVKLTDIPSLIDVDPFTYQKCSFYTRTPSFEIDKSIFISIAGPGWAQDKFIPENRYSIMWTMIESKNCHPDMGNWFKNVNEIWAPTSVDRARFMRLLETDRPINIINLGYDEKLYNSQVKPIDIINLRGRYVFGVLGSWNKRKGIKQIIRAFCKAFKSSDNVSLLLVCKYATRPYDGIKDDEMVTKEDMSKWDIIYEFIHYTKNLPKPFPHIVFVDIPIHENTLPNVLARFDCGVGFSMGESTWLPGLQLMGIKKPVIQLQSDCSGFSDYMNESNSHLCKNVEYVLADDELVKGTSEYYDGQYFAQGNENELAEMMKRVYINRNEHSLKAKVENGYNTVKDWTWTKSVESVIRRLKEIKG